MYSYRVGGTNSKHDPSEPLGASSGPVSLLDEELRASFLTKNTRQPLRTAAVASMPPYCACDPCSCGPNCKCMSRECERVSLIEMGKVSDLEGLAMAAGTQSVDLAIGGMTCSMCSDSVRQALENETGVQSVSVSLATSLAHVEFIPSEECNPDSLKECIEDIGYDVTDVILPQETQPSLKTIELAVGGMTCSMCTSAVHSALIETPGVVSASVSLSTNSARVEYEESPECNADILQETIEDIGYDVNGTMDVEDMKTDTNQSSINHDGAAPDDSRLQRILGQQNNQLQARKRDFLWSLMGSVPILTITMVLPRLFMPDCALMSFLKGTIQIAGHPFVVESLFLWILATPVQFICGYSFYKTSYYGISRGIFGMDVLVTIGTTSSYVYAAMATWTGDRGYRFFETSAVLFCFVLLGKWMNAMAVVQTSSALTQLMKLQAKTAILVIPGTKDTMTWNPLTDSYKENTVPIQQIKTGDVVKVLKGASIPADGDLIHGEMSVDESMITGESVPVLKTPGSTILGGTICTETGNEAPHSNDLAAAAFIRVTGVGSSTALAQIVQLVQDAQSRQVPIQNLADSVSSIFVPTVVAFSFVTFLIWYGCCKHGVVPTSWYEGESPATFSLLFGIACLVISCPCALGLATPTAVMVGTGVAARHGVLMKGGETLELASKVDSVVFDKTGTLTSGKPVVTDLSRVCSDDVLASMATSLGLSVDDCLIWLLGSLERNSEHPLANAIVRHAEEHLNDELERVAFAQPSNFAAITGRGASGMIRGCEVAVGNRSYAERKNIAISSNIEQHLQSLERDGKTASLVSIDGIVCAVVGAADEVKAEAVESIQYLRSMGIDVWMVTGDSHRTAKSIARILDIPSSRVISEALPVSKVEQIRKLQSSGHRVAMIGDGVNDSPALAEADVGISMGTGAEIATEASDMVLVSGKVSDACTALHLSRVIFRRIQWNLVFSMVYNLLAIPIAAGLLFPLFHTRLPPTVAALAMALSSVSVVCSSLALKLYRPPRVVGQQESPGRRVRFRFLHQQPDEYSPVPLGDSVTPRPIEEIV